jgi:hypothetical protein
MLSGAHFYYRHMRRSVTAFGTLFKDIVLVKYTNDVNFKEIDRRVVGLSYGGKDNFMTRLYSAPDLPLPVEIVLPTMSFELLGMEYDSSRKQQSQLQTFNKVSGINNSVRTQYTGVPYNLKFDLQIYARHVEDGLQIVEQILPYFNPEYTLTMDFVDDMSLKRNVPVILDNVIVDSQYQGDAKQEERILIWTLNFTMQTYFYGPITSGGLIKTATANTFFYADGSQSALVLTTANTPFGNFQVGETVYQGNSVPNANATGVVAAWNPSGGQLTISGIQGKFTTNANIHGALSSGSVNVITIPQDTKLVSIVVTPNPPSANLGDDFGFTTSIKEFPNIT